MDEKQNTVNKKKILKSLVLIQLAKLILFTNLYLRNKQKKFPKAIFTNFICTWQILEIFEIFFVAANRLFNDIANLKTDKNYGPF